jgi:hypothetical protein
VGDWIIIQDTGKYLGVILDPEMVQKILKKYQSFLFSFL